VEEFASYGQILAKKADHKVLAYEGMAGDSRSLLKALSSVRPGESILFVVGPEGGFSEKEAKMALEAGFSFVSLGGRILRAETAAIYGASVISASVEE
jgi:16S rRNA (uracil1498-N3)-methyltransferase